MSRLAPHVRTIASKRVGPFILHYATRASKLKILDLINLLPCIGPPSLMHIQTK